VDAVVQFGRREDPGATGTDPVGGGSASGHVRHAGDGASRTVIVFMFV
jgi:hypothetical protein